MTLHFDKTRFIRRHKTLAIGNDVVNIAHHYHGSRARTVAGDVYHVVPGDGRADFVIDHAAERAHERAHERGAA